MVDCPVLACRKLAVHSNLGPKESSLRVSFVAFLCIVYTRMASAYAHTDECKQQHHTNSHRDIYNIVRTKCSLED
jgi:uncharacterized protein YjaG (DUF416 family)